MKKRYNLIDITAFDKYWRLTWWPITQWYKYFGWRGLFSWIFCFKNLNGAYFHYEEKPIVIEKPGFQICIFGFQFGWLNVYND